MLLHNNFRQYALIIILLACVFSLQGQSVKELESQRKQTLKNLETTNRMLTETKKSQKSTLNKLTIINKNIKERKTLISNINNQIGQLESEMQRLEREKNILQNKLQSLKSDYVKLVQEAHIKRSMYAKIMFVLSSKSFDQSYRRLRYLQEYSDYRKEQVLEIEKVKVQIEEKNDSLSKHKNSKIIVVKEKETETKVLSKDEQKEKILLNDLKKKEKTLVADLKVQQKKASDLNNKIARIIAEEIRKAEAKRAEAERQRLAKEHKAKSSSGTTAKTSRTTTSTSKSTQSVTTLTKEETLLSGDFQKNQGRMPWPTSNGFIRGHYGNQRHPILKHITTNNKGIYIQTPSGSSARAVFDGVVTQCFSIPGSNNAVIIKHGNYRTVYANLTQISVREGDKVTAKQNLGRIYTDSENDNKTELYFQVWNGKSILNPESWIAR